MDGVTNIQARKRGPEEPPRIDATSWRLLVELSADLAACQKAAEAPHTAPTCNVSPPSSTTCCSGSSRRRGQHEHSQK
jgi:hypothetical protein